MKTNKMMALGLVAFFSMMSAAWAAGNNFATVDIGKVFDEYEKTKAFDEKFQTEGRLKQEERDAIIHEVRRLRDEQALLSKEKRGEKQGPHFGLALDMIDELRKRFAL